MKVAILAGRGTRLTEETTTKPLERLASDGQLMAYIHTSFWQYVDTLPEKILLGKLWQSGRAPWKTWKG